MDYICFAWMIDNTNKGGSSTDISWTAALFKFKNKKSEKQDSNLRPPGPKPGALPSWAIFRNHICIP